jgi:hypothetical protein
VSGNIATAHGLRRSVRLQIELKQININKWANNNNSINIGLGLLDPAEGVPITRRNIGSYLPVGTA